MRLQGGCDIEIIATGDELLFGRTLDTNSNWIAKRAAELGARLRRVTMIGDEPEEIAKAALEALGRGGKFIIFTGGLGPSQDDLTVESIGRALGRRVVLDPGAAEKIREVYRRRGITDTRRGERMARILEGSRPVPNPVGMATGMMLEEGGKIIITLPGIPQEMKGMFDQTVAPLLEEKTGCRLLARAVNVRMVWKDFFPVYRRLQRDFPDIYIKNAATPPQADEERVKVKEIKVDLVLEAPTQEEAEEEMDALLEEYQRRIDEAGGGEIIPIE